MLNKRGIIIIIYFYLRYIRDPLANTRRNKIKRGTRLATRGMYTLNKLLSHQFKRARASNALRKSIHGLSILYGFKPICFKKDNFEQKNRQLYFRGHPCNTNLCCILLNALLTQLRNIHAYSNISSLKRSRYNKYIRIYGVSQYYHPHKVHYAKNMRNELSKLAGHRCRFTGTYIRFGHKPGGQTVLVDDICYHDKKMTDHVWMTATKSFRELRSYLPPKSHIAFNARVKEYQKGQISKDFFKHVDYTLALPTKVQILDKDGHND